MVQRRPTEPETFLKHLKKALEHYGDPRELGISSPLAAPYFLGQALTAAAITPEARGQVLTAEIDSALEIMWGEAFPSDSESLLTAVREEDLAVGHGRRYDCLILELNYFKKRFRPAPKNQAEIYHDILHISRASHDRHLRTAVEHLGDILLSRLRPTFRLERPSLNTTIIGREKLQIRIMENLLTGRSVALTGEAGAGKTTLGVAIFAQWPTPATFWFTIRPTFSDHLSSLLFALGNFLHRQRASTLWLQLVASGGQIRDLNLALGLARADLQSLHVTPLLVLDEVDLLTVAVDQKVKEKHLRLLEFVDGLRDYAPLLLIGQRIPLETEVSYLLRTLTREEVLTWLDAAGLGPSEAEIERLIDYTGGNPRLLELCLALRESLDQNITITDLLDELPKTPALAPLWHRLERRLSDSERFTLLALAVFRNPAPTDAAELRADRDVLEREDVGDLWQAMQKKKLVQVDGQGGVALMPALKTVLYEDLSFKLRDDLHYQAAEIRKVRGEFTAAAYHYWRAGEPARAVFSWYPHREEEIRRGQGEAALDIFKSLPVTSLNQRMRKQLAIVQSELFLLTGETGKVIESLENEDWSVEEEADVDAALLWGNALQAQGQDEAALDKYQENGIEVVSRLLHKATHLHVQRSLAYVRGRDMEAAWREARLARYQAENMQGAVQDQLGNYTAARGHYQVALSTAQELEDVSGIAQAHHYLAILAGRQQRMEEATRHFEQAISYYENVGDRLNTEVVRGNLASMHIQAGHFSKALEPARAALAFFETIGDPFRVAHNASNLAEAYSELGRFREAEQYANLVLDQEVPHSRPYALFTLGSVRHRQKKLDESHQFFKQSEELAEANEDTYLLAYARRALGEVLVDRGEHSAAAYNLDSSLDLFRSLGIDPEVTRTQVLIERNETISRKNEA